LVAFKVRFGFQKTQKYFPSRSRLTPRLENRQQAQPVIRMSFSTMHQGGDNAIFPGCFNSLCRHIGRICTIGHLHVIELCGGSLRAAERCFRKEQASQLRDFVHQMQGSMQEEEPARAAWLLGNLRKRAGRLPE
jgi:hypothetical protein